MKNIIILITIILGFPVLAATAMHLHDETEETGQKASVEKTEKDDEEDKKGLPLKAERKLQYKASEGSWMSLDVSPDGKHVYVTSAGDSAVALFNRQSGTGALTFVEVQKDDSAGVDGLAGANFLALSPEGTHVYVTGFNENSFAVFQRQA